MYWKAYNSGGFKLIKRTKNGSFAKESAAEEDPKKTTLMDFHGPKGGFPEELGESPTRNGTIGY